MKIENAKPDDVLALVELGALMFTESEHYRQFSIDGTKVFNLLNYLIEDPSGIVIVAREADGRAVGGFVGGVAEMWFSSETKVMYDNALFIHPAHRKGRLAMRLIQEAFAQARAKGAAEAILSNSTGFESGRVEKLFGFIGMTRQGGVYSKLL